MSANVPIASSRSLNSSHDEPNVVHQWAEQTQRRFGDSLPPDEIVTIPASCQAQIITNELSKLKIIWEGLTPERRYNFSNKYGYIAELMYIPVNCFAIQALVDSWDPAYRCFAFKEFDLLPTIEEYHVILGIPERAGETIYCFNPNAKAKRTLSKFLGIHADKVQKHIQMNGEEEFIALDYLIELTHNFLNEDKGLILLALCIYGTVLYPRAKGYVDGQVLILFFNIEQGVNPIIPILAETVRALCHCRAMKEGKLRCCVPLLYIWMHSHIRFPDSFRCPRIKFSSCWNLLQNIVVEFGTALWDSNFPNTEVWATFLSEIKLENVIWKAHWMPLKDMIYRCGSFHTVPLLGPWGCIHYAPLLALRQLWFKQFIPATHDLNKLGFSYGGENLKEEKRQVLASWKLTKRMRSNDHCEASSLEYLRWHTKRNKSFQATTICENREEFPSRMITDRLNQDVAECRRLLERNQTLELENGKLQQEVNRLMVQATHANGKLEEANGIIERQAKRQRNHDWLDDENKSLSKENHVLKRRNSTLQRTVRLQEIKINDFTKGKSSLLELISEMKDIIRNKEKQLTELERANVGLYGDIDNHLEGYNILKDYASLLEQQLGAYQKACEKLSQEKEHLEKEYSSIKQDYHFVRDDMQMVIGKVNRTMDTIKIMARRARGFAKWARHLQENTSPMTANAEELFEFLRMIRSDLGYFGHFH